MSKELVLTDNERALILKRREEAEEVKRKKDFALNCLMVASDFAQYIDGNGCGRSYSTFCNDFGYEGGKGENRSHTWDVVIKLMDTAKRGS